MYVCNVYGAEQLTWRKLLSFSEGKHATEPIGPTCTLPPVKGIYDTSICAYEPSMLPQCFWGRLRGRFREHVGTSADMPPT